MKKILILFVAAVISSVICIGQEKENAATTNSRATELMINGKPYSQYKAEQEALKQTKANQVAAAKASIPDPAKSDVTKTIAPGSQPKPAVKETKQVSDDERETIKVRPQVVTATEPVKTATASENKVAVPVAAKSSSADPDAKSVAPAKQTTISAAVPAQNSGNTAPATEKPAAKD